MAVQNSFSNAIQLKEKPYCRVYGLWLAPKVEVGPKGFKVAVIKHAEFDYKALGELIGGLFWQSANVQVRIANDVIDVATFDNRLCAMNAKGSTLNSSNLFQDFGKALMRCSRQHVDGVIDVRNSKAWSSLKSKAGLVDHVYPPQILPFVVLADRKEDTNWWYMHSLEAIDNTPLEIANMASAFAGEPKATKRNEGALPGNVLKQLEQLFEVTFESRAMLVKMASHAG